MKTNKLLLGAALVAGIGFTACNNAAKSNESADAHAEHKTEAPAEVMTVAVNKEASVVAWRGSVSSMYFHTGTVKLTEASVEMTGKAISGGSFTVDMTSLVATDENYDVENGKTSDKLIGHLSAPDFFDVANHPTASFEITGSEGNTVTGKLTVRGITHDETVENVAMTEVEGVKTVTGTLTFDRQKYDVAYKSTMKDVVISDDIELTISLAKAAE